MAGIQKCLQALSIDRLDAFDTAVIEKSVEQSQLTILAGELASHGALGAQVLFDVRSQDAVKAVPEGGHSTSSPWPMTISRSLCTATLP